MQHEDSLRSQRSPCEQGAMQSNQPGKAQWHNAITRARAHSPFLALALDRQPELEAMLAEGAGETALAEARNAGASVKDVGIEDVGVALRRERLALAVVLAIGDLAGAFPLARVMHELSNFADRALDAAIRAAIARSVPDAPPEGFTALALGKQGAGELNYSSDIDPILLYDPQRLPHRSRDEPGEAAQRYARTIIELLSRQTGEGYVFRVDLRLRPASEVSPLAISFAAALTHYENAALTWERAAYIRARAAAGDIAAGEAFLADIRPFVWRRSFDFTAIEEVRRLTARIRHAAAGPREVGPGFDIKRGRGGIREVEFFAQTQQLIYGGRMPALRVRGTRDALDALAAEGIIKAEQAQLLGTGYDRLRTIEHRLQMVEDRQAHTLPDSTAALDNVALLDGLADGAALVDELRQICAEIGAQYDDLLGDDVASPYGGAKNGAPPSDAAKEWHQHHAGRIAKWRNTMRCLRSTEANAAFDAILPDLVAALAGAPDPDHALARWERLLIRLPSAVNMFRIFEQRPALLDQVLKILTLAGPLADRLARRPELLDALIDSTALDLPENIALLAERMQPINERVENGAENKATTGPTTNRAAYELTLDRIRQVVGEERFALGVQLIEAAHDPLEIAAGLGRVAEAALIVASAAATAEFEAAHGRIAGGAMLVMGLGRLGGRSLTHASDLDLVYLFTGEIGSESDGPRPLTASLYFNRLAQRITAALSVPTAEGALYEVDTRLRPQGNHGPLAASLDSFARYQHEDAWTWEHMALTRARPIIGPENDRKQLVGILLGVLKKPRDEARLRADVLAMRAEISAHKKPAGPLDVKLLRGGLIDIEFIVHYLQLREGIALDPQLDSAIGALIDAGTLPPPFADDYALLARMLVTARLLAPDGREPAPAAQTAMAASCGAPDFATLLQKARKARQGIGACWAELFGETLEITT